MPDEFLHVLDGDMELTIIGDDGPETVTASKGMVVIVPKGQWHWPVAKTMVTLFSVTPSADSDIFPIGKTTAEMPISRT